MFFSDKDKLQSYWEERGQDFFQYRGENFYTITPIPYYVKRRELLLNLATPYIQTPAARKILDFGCGDGWYLAYFSTNMTFNSKSWYGTDIAYSMLERAKTKCPEAILKKCSDGIPFIEKFDVIYTFSVFAHIIDNEALSKIVASISNALEQNGIWLLFEQTAPFNYGHTTFIRRPSNFYVRLAHKHALSVVDRKIIQFPAHQYFERTLAKLWYKYLSAGKTDHERRVNANKSSIFTFLSKLSLILTLRPIREDNSRSWGYSFLVFKKIA